MHWTRVPTGVQWREMVAALADAPEVERARLETIAQFLDRARAVGEFDRVRIVGSILPLLSEWDDLYPYPSPLRDRMQGLWNVALPAIQSSVVDLFASECATISDLVRYRYVTFQHMHSSIALLIHHPLSRVTGGTHLLERSNLEEAIGRLARAMTERLPGDWIGEEMRAHLSGGNTSTRLRTVERIVSALASIGIEAHEPVLLRREGEQAPLNMLFDRLTGRFAPFSPAFDPISLGLRSLSDQNRSRIQAQDANPELHEHVPGTR